MKVFRQRPSSLLQAAAQRLPVNKLIVVKFKVNHLPTSAFCTFSRLSSLSTKPFNIRQLSTPPNDQETTGTNSSNPRDQDTHRTDEPISVFELSQQFNPPPKSKRSFPTGFFGLLQVSKFERYLIRVGRGVK